MASIGGLTSATSSASSIRGYGGLASGIDRDTLIEQLTYGTQSKIAKQEQNKQSLEWEQEAIRGITDKIYDFTDKYTSYASPSTNLTGSGLFSRNQITAEGVNSKYISVSGTSSSADMLSIVGIKQMAEDAKIMGATASNGELLTGSIANNLETGEYKVNQIENQRIYITHGSQRYTVTLGSGDGYDYEKNLAGALNKAFENVEITGTNDDGTTRKLSDVLEASLSSDGKLQLTSKDSAGNSIEITGGTGDVLQRLGFLDEGESIEDVFGKDGFILENNEVATANNNADIFETTKLSDYLAGKTLNFNYNGVTATIEIGSGLTSMADLQADLQSKLNDAFGKNRVQVTLQADGGDAYRLQFKTVKPNGADTVEDASSMLTITGGSTGLLGKESGLLGINAGATTRLDPSMSLEEAGTARKVDMDQAAELTINGVPIQGINWDSSIEEIMEAINSNEEAGVTVTYQQNSDRFMIVSNEKGASGSIKLEGNVAQVLFGTEAMQETVYGKDAIIAVQYAGDSTVTEITRDSNAFTVDGLNLSLKGTFGYSADGVTLDPTAEAITFDAQVDVDTTTDVVKQMIEDFNSILKLVHDEVNQKPDRDYAPLTDDQKAEMSEEQIEKWEAKAKEGLLFNDTDVRGLADALRFIIPASMQSEFAAIGISVSTDYSDNGKLVFDETKFRAALESDPEKVRDLFTRKASEDENGNTIQAGLMENMSNVMKTYAGTTGATKGILVERAGSVHAPTSVLQNSLQKQLDEIDDLIERLQEQLKTEQDRYISQFTSLETLVAQMNSQSSYLAQLSGGY